MQYANCDMANIHRPAVSFAPHPRENNLHEICSSPGEVQRCCPRTEECLVLIPFPQVFPPAFCARELSWQASECSGRCLPKLAKLNLSPPEKAREVLMLTHQTRHLYSNCGSLLSQCQSLEVQHISNMPAARIVLLQRRSLCNRFRSLTCRVLSRFESKNYL